MSGQFYFEPGELVPLLEKFGREHPAEGRVVIRVDRNVPYEFTQEVMSAVADSNIPSVLFSTLETEISASIPTGGG